MERHEAKLLVRTYYAAAFDQNDLDLARNLLAPSFLSHGPSGSTVDAALHLQMLAFSHAALSNLRVEIEDQIAEEDKVVTRLTARGMHTGKYLGIPPSGHQIVARAIHIHRLERGRIAEQWEQIDLHGIMQQLGSQTGPGS